MGSISLLPHLDKTCHLPHAMLKLVTLALCLGLASMCDISIKNVGQVAFTWHIEYAGSWDYDKTLEAGQHDNYECACVPHDMKILVGEDFYCYHYMNCLDNQDFEVEVTDYAVYINVGHNNVEMCVI
eukprot:TRINITY_DN9625_c0_g1_i2.p1 TRINITY_DN9625_c0_g1~~TRINITY_DN9625_c0_g1_i2.p1  ORF type:complete len:127 (+),score=22.35 TRINITY_DN9625_c0_g1_i2:186-566(+)